MLAMHQVSVMMVRKHCRMSMKVGPPALLQAQSAPVERIALQRSEMGRSCRSASQLILFCEMRLSWPMMALNLLKMRSHHATR